MCCKLQLNWEIRGESLGNRGKLIYFIHLTLGELCFPTGEIHFPCRETNFQGLRWENERKLEKLNSPIGETI